MEKGVFKTYHPIVIFTYFVFAVGFSCFFMHPVPLVMSLTGGLLYTGVLSGGKGVKKNLIYILPVLVLMALLNPLFNHQGVTIIGYLPGGNPLTLESVIYGISSSLMLACVVFWFSCYNKVVTSDKFIYLFGKIIPALSLVFSMTLRFVPKFTKQLKVVATSQKCMGRDISKGSIIKRAKCGLNILSIMTTWSLENSIETADSMKARGYGLSGRSAYSIYTFDKRDKSALFTILMMAFYILLGSFFGCMQFEYFPKITAVNCSVYEISVMFAYLLFFIYPILLEIKEVKKWKALKSKI